MLLDREAGRPMEIEVILGNVVRKGVELDVQCPIMTSVYDLLKVVDWVIQEPKLA
jgi:ketopantoate reductase